MSSCMMYAFRSERRRKIATTICASSGGAIPKAWFDIALTRDAPHEGIDKLFFVNLGGYDPAEFSELHKNILLVAPDAKAAKAKALARIEDWSLPHKDSLFEVEKAIDVTAQLQQYGYFLKLTKAVSEKPFKFICDYLPIA